MPPFEYNKYCSCARCRIHGLIGPAMIITVGVLMLIQSFGRIYMHQTWPVFLLVIGLFLLGSRTASVEGHVPPGRPAMMPPPQYQYPPQTTPGAAVPAPPQQYQYPPQAATAASVPAPPAAPPQPNDQQVKP